MWTTTYATDGMVCRHCAASVSAELERVPGVIGVRVDLAAGTVTVTATHPLDDGVVRAAVEEAGFRMARDQRRSVHETGMKSRPGYVVARPLRKANADGEAGGTTCVPRG